MPRWKWVVGISVVGIVVLGAAVSMKDLPGVSAGEDVAARTGPDEGQAAPQDALQEEDAVSVKTVRPRQDPSFAISVEEPAYVQAYYQADLMAKVAGPVKSIQVDIGSRVKKDQALAIVDVPDIQEEVEQKSAIIQQRQKELELAKADVRRASAGVEAARGTLAIVETGVEEAKANRDFREKELRRFTRLASGPDAAVTPEVIDERTLYLKSATVACAKAHAEVIKANADLEEANAKLAAANADVDLKTALVQVASKDRDHAQAILDFATIGAPFNGVVIRRNVDPGSFVQNAATGHSDPLLTIARTDIVTVYMKVPDNFAPFVTPDTEAIIRMKSLPALSIRARLTRFSPSVETLEHDRTMRVEVDLYNANPAGYQAFLDREKATGNADLKAGPVPQLPAVETPQSPQALNLLPGMYGSMRLLLRSFRNAYLLPSSVVVSEGGEHFVFLVKDNRAVKVPVDVQADDGKMAKLVLIEKSGRESVRKELTGNEEVVSSNQGELSNGRLVKTTPE